MMVEWQGAPVMDYFRDLEDPRIERSKQHRLLDIVAIAICAVICGADSWVYVEMFGRSKEEWFRTFLDLPNGIPSHDTFGDVFSRLDPEQFQKCFVEWTQDEINRLHEHAAGATAGVEDAALEGWIISTSKLTTHLVV